jgi:hypothetical protein
VIDAAAEIFAVDTSRINTAISYYGITPRRLLRRASIAGTGDDR